MTQTAIQLAGILLTCWCLGCASGDSYSLRPDSRQPIAQHEAAVGRLSKSSEPHSSLENRFEAGSPTLAQVSPAAEKADGMHRLIQGIEPPPNSGEATHLASFEQSPGGDSAFPQGLATSPPVVTEAQELPGIVADDVETRELPGRFADAPLRSEVVAQSGLASEASAIVPLNLPSALAAVDRQHPIVAQAQWSVQAAYAELDRAKTLWLPSIQAGFSFHRHDGNYQASDGSIIDINRNSFQYGLGMGATGAGTTPRPGLVANFHMADAIFLPKLARKNAWAEDHAADAIRNRQLLAAGQAYLGLLEAYQDLRILEQSQERFANLTKITVDFAEAGEGLQADADRLRTEWRLTESRLLNTREQTSVASAKLAQAISLDGFPAIIPLDENAVPFDLAQDNRQPDALISSALQSRPELKECQALVAAACEAYRREKYAPFVPSVLLGFSTGGFGGGLGNELDDVEGRYDLDALLAWEIRNMGLGERAARRARSARVQQAQFEKLAVMDQVASEVRQASAKVAFRQQQVEITRSTIATAKDSYRLNLERIRDRQGLPLEVLQSVQALETAQRAYLHAVTEYNQAQLELQWSLGFPLSG